MGNKKYNKIKRYTLVEQWLALKIEYPESECTYHKSILRWTGVVRPTACSKGYNVSVEYANKKKPVIWVTGDELEKLDDVNFPHNYGVNQREKSVKLCLYRYSSEFNESRLLANTILPWTVDWLYYYEVWLVTGEWYGGGEHPATSKTKRENLKSTEELNCS